MRLLQRSEAVGVPEQLAECCCRGQLVLLGQWSSKYPGEVVPTCLVAS